MIKKFLVTIGDHKGHYAVLENSSLDGKIWSATIKCECGDRWESETPNKKNAYNHIKSSKDRN